MTQRLFIVLFVVATATLSSVAFAEMECTADIRGTLMRKEAGNLDTKFIAKVDVSARETCAMINFDLIVVEEESGGKQFEVRVPKRVRVRDSAQSSLKLNYKLKKGRQVASHRFVQTGCRLCE